MNDNKYKADIRIFHMTEDLESDYIKEYINLNMNNCMYKEDVKINNIYLTINCYDLTIEYIDLKKGKIKTTEVIPNHNILGYRMQEQTKNYYDIDIFVKNILMWKE
jgi:hypothetical protein